MTTYLEEAFADTDKTFVDLILSAESHHQRAARLLLDRVYSGACATLVFYDAASRAQTIANFDDCRAAILGQPTRTPGGRVTYTAHVVTKDHLLSERDSKMTHGLSDCTRKSIADLTGLSSRCLGSLASNGAVMYKNELVNAPRLNLQIVHEGPLSSPGLSSRQTLILRTSRSSQETFLSSEHTSYGPRYQPKRL
ncbi:hypothetical protein CC2G_006531 [Coprinopsis cinerea AmutBmut pab1-1]|nr:hypothetical protein CC2G_006531 [Coprinopsis cinerea AmutBmut pab1-1]